MASIIEARLFSNRVLTRFFTKKCSGSLFNGYARTVTTNENYNETPNDEIYDIAIVGGGLVGTTLACALANNQQLESKRIVLLEGSNKRDYKIPEQYSNRVVALNSSTKLLLSSIGAWKHIESVRYTPVRKMQVWDACSDAMITFNEDQLSNQLAYIVENDCLLYAVDTQLSQKESVKVIHNAQIDNIILPCSEGVHSNISLKSGENLKAKLLIGSDGQKSLVRETMGVKYIEWDYDQMGIVATVKLSEPTDNIVAWQRFLPTGPVALLPLTDSLSSLVWSVNTTEAKRLLKLSEEEFVDNLNDALWKVYSKDNVVEGGMKALQQLLQSLQLQTGVSRQLPPSINSIIEGSRAAFPLGFGHAVHYVKTGVALVGDAAHRVHPLAGLGVNLGFGDVSALVMVLAEGANNGALISDIRYLYEYETIRQQENIPRMLAIDALYRLYNKTASPIVLARSLGLQLVNSMKPLKKFIMERASGMENMQR